MIVINILSLIFDGILSTILSKNSIFIPLFSIVSLLVIYPFLSKKENIFIYGAIIGYLYDVVYTQTPFLNTMLFLLISVIIQNYFKFLPINFHGSLFLLLLIILIFRSSSYLILVLVGDINFEFNLLFKSFYTSVLSNILYYILISFILKKYYKKKNRKHSYKYNFKK